MAPRNEEFSPALPQDALSSNGVSPKSAKHLVLTRGFAFAFLANHALKGGVGGGRRGRGVSLPGTSVHITVLPFSLKALDWWWKGRHCADVLTFDSGRWG